jgi:hypothetical protein
MREIPEALRLAYALKERHGANSFEDDAATELRRLHADNERLNADNDALRRDAERYRRLLKWLIVTGLLSRERCRIDSPASYGDWWVLRKPHGVGVLVLGYGQTEDAAIDAAMEDKT